MPGQLTQRTTSTTSRRALATITPPCCPRLGQLASRHGTRHTRSARRKGIDLHRRLRGQCCGLLQSFTPLPPVPVAWTDAQHGELMPHHDGQRRQCSRNRCSGRTRRRFASDAERFSNDFEHPDAAGMAATCKGGQTHRIKGEPQLRTVVQVGFRASEPHSESLSPAREGLHPLPTVYACLFRPGPFL